MPFGETSSREQHFKLSNLLTIASATEISVDTRRLAPKKVNEEWTSNFERNLYLGNFEFKINVAWINLLHSPLELLKNYTFSYTLLLQGISYAPFLQVLFEMTEICLVITPF